MTLSHSGKIFFQIYFLTLQEFHTLHNSFWSFYSDIILSFPPNPSLQKVSPTHTHFHVFFGLGLGGVYVWWGKREREEQRTLNLVGITFMSMHMRFFTGPYGPNFLELIPLRKMSPCPPSSHYKPIECRKGVGFRSLA